MSNQADLPAMATELLDTHFPNATPDVIRARFEGLLTNYFQTKGQSIMSKAIPEAGTLIEGPALATQEQMAALQKQIADLSAVVSSFPQALAVEAQKEAARRAEVDSLFAVSGMSAEQVAKFHADHPAGGIDQARKVVLDALLSKQGGTIKPGSNDLGEHTDPDAKFKKEYADDVEYFRKSGTSEADYVLSRRITENHNGRPMELKVVA